MITVKQFLEKLNYFEENDLENYKGDALLSFLLQQQALAQVPNLKLLMHPLQCKIAEAFLILCKPTFNNSQ